MHPQRPDELQACLSADPHAVYVPALVKGRLVVPEPLSPAQLMELRTAASANPLSSRGLWTSRAGENWVMHAPRPAQAPPTSSLPLGRDDAVPRRDADSDSAGHDAGSRLFVFPRFPPASLLHTDVRQLARELYALSTAEVLQYVEALGRSLAGLVQTAGSAPDTSPVAALLTALLLDDPLAPVIVDQLPLLFDPQALGEAIDRELAVDHIPGRHYLDGWVGVPATAPRGFTARVADHVFGGGPPADFQPQVRAIPTRQLHITAGNSPFIPVLSFLRGLAVKGALVIKSPAECAAVAALLALGMTDVDPTHPITRHTSLVYWPGGDRSIEDVLFQPGAFDRIVAWGSPETVRNIRQRVDGTKTVFFHPRFGVSLIGREAFPAHLAEAAQRACTDSMIANQQACISSLVHYVEGSEEEALQYCRELQTALARWDERIVYTLPKYSQGQIRLLRRGAWLQGKWFLNRRRSEISSAVVYLPHPFDVSQHPQSRVIAVRRLQHRDELIPLLTAAVSTLGVYPSSLLALLRDAAAAAGVTTLFPLGEAERNFAGMPHDGMRVLDELVNWATSSEPGVNSRSDGSADPLKSAD